jgi:uncharacterized protein (DUF305 family)
MLRERPEGGLIMKRGLVIASTVLVLVLMAGVVPWRAVSTAAQMGPGMGSPPEQLAGDAFDRTFLMQMTMHHAMGVMMTQPVAASASHAELQDLGERMVADQTREIEQMRAWLRDWYGLDLSDMVAMMEARQDGSMPMGWGHLGRGPMGNGMPGAGPMGNSIPGAGPMMPETPGGPGQIRGMSGLSMMSDLRELPPNRLEAVFMSLMIPHHQGAIALASLAPDRAAHPELVDLARRIVESQSAEIDQLNAWLAAWYGL